MCLGAPRALDADVDEHVTQAVGEALVDSAEVPTEKLSQLGWPETQKDLAPCALLVPAGRCLGKQNKKITDVIKRFDDVDKTHWSETSTKLSS